MNRVPKIHAGHLSVHLDCWQNKDCILYLDGVEPAGKVPADIGEIADTANWAAGAVGQQMKYSNKPADQAKSSFEGKTAESESEPGPGLELEPERVVAADSQIHQMDSEEFVDIARVCASEESVMEESGSVAHKNSLELAVDVVQSHVEPSAHLNPL